MCGGELQEQKCKLLCPNLSVTTSSVVRISTNADKKAT